MEKRNYKRRTSAEVIEDLQNKIQAIEVRVEAKKRKDLPVLREFSKVKKSLGKFAQTCVDHDRNDLSNSVLAFLSTLERQAQSELQESR
ncbi:MAG: Mg2+ and Co2+ transporter CorA [Glaciecola sp.]|jgi:Mg2+ and Co2+ transporter CorA